MKYSHHLCRVFDLEWSRGFKANSSVGDFIELYLELLSE